MAIKKRDAGRNLTDEERAFLKELETYIDQELDARYNPERPDAHVAIDYAKLQKVLGKRITLNFRLVNAIIALYTDPLIGWKVKIEETNSGRIVLEFS